MPPRWQWFCFPSPLPQLPPGCEEDHSDTRSVWNAGIRAQGTLNNRVENSEIHHVGVFNKNGAGVGLRGAGNVVSHNLIHHCPHMAVRFSDREDRAGEMNPAYFCAGIASRSCFSDAASQYPHCN